MQEREKLANDRKRDDAEWQTVQEFLANLSVDERETVIDAAINNSSEFTRDFARKFCHNPTASSGEIMYQMALKDYVLPMIDTEWKQPGLENIVRFSAP